MATYRPPRRHPAPIPEEPGYPGIPRRLLPPELRLRGFSSASGVYISWDRVDKQAPLPTNIKSFEVFYYKERENQYPDVSLWMLLVEKNLVLFPATHIARNLDPFERYHLIIRCKDTEGRCGPFSNAVSVFWIRPYD